MAGGRKIGAAHSVFLTRNWAFPERRRATARAWVNRAVVHQHLASPALWSIFQLQDRLGMDDQSSGRNPEDERINDPANPNQYWRYRMPLSLESLNQAQAFNLALHEAVRQNGRAP